MVKKRWIINGIPVNERITEAEAVELGIDKRGRCYRLSDQLEAMGLRVEITEKSGVRKRR